MERGVFFSLQSPLPFYNSPAPGHQADCFIPLKPLPLSTPKLLMGRLGRGETVVGELATRPDQSSFSAALQLPEVTATAQAAWLGCTS